MRSLCRRGEFVHLVCQENHPERYDFIGTAVTHNADGSRVVTLSRDVPYDGCCILHKPEIVGPLPVFVWDKYEEHERVVPMVDLPTTEIEAYVNANLEVVAKIVAEERVTVIHANHAVMMPVVAQRVEQRLGIPFTVMPHGSDIEYAVKKDSRFLDYACSAFAAARRIFVIGDEMQDRVLKVFASVPDLEDKLVELHLGVDTEEFGTIARAERAQEIDALVASLARLPSGKTREQERYFERALADLKDAQSLPEILREAARYDGKRPDERAAEKIRGIAWDSAPTLLFVGRLIAWKGIQSLIAALPFALAKEPGARVIVVGHGPLREAMEALVWALGSGRRDIAQLIVERGREIDGSAGAETGDGALAELNEFFFSLAERGQLEEYFARAHEVLKPGTVIFTGYLTHDELKHLFPCCDVGVFPSVVREAGPLVFLEALASGCFPLGTYFGGMRASIDSIGTVLPEGISELMQLSPKRTIDDLARKIPSSLEAAPRYRKVLSAFARENYDWSSVTARLLAEVESVGASATTG